MCREWENGTQSSVPESIHVARRSASAFQSGHDFAPVFRMKWNSTMPTSFSICRARRITHASSRQRSEQNRFLFLIEKEPALQNGFWHRSDMLCSSVNGSNPHLLRRAVTLLCSSVSTAQKLKKPEARIPIRENCSWLLPTTLCRRLRRSA